MTSVEVNGQPAKSLRGNCAEWEIDLPIAAADNKITALATGTVLHSDDWLVYVDVHDTSMASTGTDKKLSPAVLTAGLVPFVASGSSSFVR